MKVLNPTQWQTIESFYPLTYGKLVGETAENQKLVCNQNGVPINYTEDDDHLFEDHDLFYFFHDNGIHVTIEYRQNLDRDDDCFGYKIEDKVEVIIRSGKMDGRKRTESQALYHAFEVLEKELVSQTGS